MTDQSPIIDIPEFPYSTPEEFTEAVEEYVWKEDVSYTEALSYFVELYQIEYKDVKSVIGQTIIDKIELEIREQRLLRDGAGNTNSLLNLF